MGRVLVTTIGSWGDLFPLLGVATELRRRGHHVEVGASPAWKDVVTAAGVDLLPVGRSIGFDEFAAHPEIFGRMPMGLRRALGRFLFDQADHVSGDLRPAVEAADVVVSHPAQLVALDLAEAAGVPTITASVFPGLLPSAHTAPGGSGLGPWQGPLGRLANRAAWASANAVTAAMFDRPVNRHRGSLGLPPVRNALLQLPLRAETVLILADPAIVDPPPDWPPSVRITGFVGWDRISGAPLDAGVDSFLDAGLAPVLVTLGASSAAVADDFFDVAVGALVDRGARVLAVTGPAAGPSKHRSRDDVHVVDFVPFSAVLPRCRAAVHHAGIGTSVAVVRAGIPQLVAPMAFDQPDTARLLERLGVAVPVPWRRRHAAMPAAVERLLGDASLAAEAERLAGRLDDRDGAALAADAVEAVMSAGRR